MLGRKVVLSNSRKGLHQRLGSHRGNSGHWQIPGNRKECMMEKMGSLVSDVWEIQAQRRLELCIKRDEKGRDRGRKRPKWKLCTQPGPAVTS